MLGGGISWIKSQQPLSVNGDTLNIFSFAEYTVMVGTT